MIYYGMVNTTRSSAYTLPALQSFFRHTPLGAGDRFFLFDNDADFELPSGFDRVEVVRNPDGTERERRPRKVNLPNASTEMPLKWSGKLFKKTDVYNKFVFASKRQIVHINGLTYDFLFNIAKELEASQSLMLMGAGPKANLPLVMQRGGQQFRGFLEGRTQGDKYCLILHLSAMELKAAPVAPAKEGE